MTTECNNLKEFLREIQSQHLQKWRSESPGEAIGHIRKAIQSRMQKAHPDKHQGTDKEQWAGERMQTLNLAKDELTAVGEGINRLIAVIAPEESAKSKSAKSSSRHPPPPHQAEGKEILAIARALASEKGVDFDIVLGAIQDSLALALRRRYADGREMDFRVAVDPEIGAMTAFRRWRILAEDEPMETPLSEMMVETAQEKNPQLDPKPGDYYEEPVEAPDFSRRVSVQVAKQNIASRLREAERQMALDAFLADGEELVHGIVKRVDRNTGEVFVEAGAVNKVDCVIRRDDLIPRESLRPGDRIRALIKMVNEGRGPQLRLTRVTPDFLKQLFQREVPEIERKVLEIVGAVRDPGNRAKIAVRSHDPKVDPVGTCVGIRGSRVQSVTAELNGERVDIIPWNEDPAQFVLRALAPAEVIRIHIDEDAHAMNILVEADNLAQAIGRGGVNVRLAADLTGWRLNLLSPQDFELKTQEEILAKSRVFAEKLDVDEEVAKALFEEGFETVEHIAYSDREEMIELKMFDDDTVDEIRKRACEVTEKEEAELAVKIKKLSPALAEMQGMDERLLRALAKNDVFTTEDLGDLATDELLEIGDFADRERAGALIMEARRPMFEGDESGESPQETARE